MWGEERGTEEGRGSRARGYNQLKMAETAGEKETYSIVLL
jgi:hypothetical protein